jgi:hypothetical protein
MALEEAAEEKEEKFTKNDVRKRVRVWHIH